MDDEQILAELRYLGNLAFFGATDHRSKIDHSAQLKVHTPGQVGRVEVIALRGDGTYVIVHASTIVSALQRLRIALQ